MAMPPTNQVVQREDARNCALACVTTALRRLAANTIDLARGRGRPADLEEEAELLLVSLDAYVQAAGELPSAAVLGEALLRSLETICDGPGGIATFGVGV